LDGWSYKGRGNGNSRRKVEWDLARESTRRERIF